MNGEVERGLSTEAAVSARFHGSLETSLKPVVQDDLRVKGVT
ncbi:hypothetical protein [Nonomuraea monospora]